jgi:hypothetical protein
MTQFETSNGDFYIDTNKSQQGHKPQRLIGISESAFHQFFVRYIRA